MCATGCGQQQFNASVNSRIAHPHPWAFALFFFKPTIPRGLAGKCGNAWMKEIMPNAQP